MGREGGRRCGKGGRRCGKGGDVGREGGRRYGKGGREEMWEGREGGDMGRKGEGEVGREGGGVGREGGRRCGKGGREMWEGREGEGDVGREGVRYVGRGKMGEEIYQEGLTRDTWVKLLGKDSDPSPLNMKYANMVTSVGWDSVLNTCRHMVRTGGIKGSHTCERRKAAIVVLM